MLVRFSVLLTLCALGLSQGACHKEASDCAVVLESLVSSQKQLADRIADSKDSDPKIPLAISERATSLSKVTIHESSLQSARDTLVQNIRDEASLMTQWQKYLLECQNESAEPVVASCHNKRDLAQAQYVDAIKRRADAEQKLSSRCNSGK